MPDIRRFISVFRRKEQDLHEEIDISFIQLDKLKEIFKPVNDPQMYLVYQIEKKEADRLSHYLNLDFDFINYQYQLDCFDISKD